MTLLIVPEAGVFGWFASWDLAGRAAEALVEESAQAPLPEDGAE